MPVNICLMNSWKRFYPVAFGGWFNRCPGDSHMNLNQLKVFYLAAKIGNLSKAARELNITQPAMTKGIQRLQDFYDIKLFNRFGKKLVLTDAGLGLYQIAEKIFDLEVKAEDSIREFQQLKKGHIRIHAGESFGAYYLPSMINPLSKKYPSIRISVTILPTELIVKNVADLKNDIGFASYHVAHEKLVCREILEDKMVFIASPGHRLVNKKRLTIMDLAGQSVIVHENGSVPSQAIGEFIRKNKIDIRIPLELSSNRAIIQAVAGGLGIALVSRHVAREEIVTGKIVVLPFPGPSLTRRFYLVHHKDKHITEVLKRLIERIDRWADAYACSLRRK
jgi:DNA-binding transcriptional LysR family regulator